MDSRPRAKKLAVKTKAAILTGLAVLLAVTPAYSFVQVVRKGGAGSKLNSRPVFVGDKLIKKGDRMSTGSKSWVGMRLAARATGVIGGGSALFVRGFTPTSTQLAVTGQLKIKIPKVSGHDFVIGGSGSVTRSGGTVFHTSSVAPRHCSAVEEGFVTLEAGKGGSQVIDQGFYSCSFDGDTPTEPKEIDRSSTLEVSEIGLIDGVPTCEIQIPESATLWEISGEEGAKPLPPTPDGAYIVSYSEARDYRVVAQTGEFTGYRVQSCKS